jgi:hypothetical protein
MPFPRHRQLNGVSVITGKPLGTGGKLPAAYEFKPHMLREGVAEAANKA